MKNKNKKGFTLIEVIVALAAFMLIMTTITTILISTIRYSSMNSRNFNKNKISQSVFEAIKESNPGYPNPGDKYDGSFKIDVDNESEIKVFVRGNIFKLGGSNSLDASNFSECSLGATKKYVVGISVKWRHDLYPGAATDIGVYEIKTYCWDREKGEGSEVQRSTFIYPR